MKNPYNGPPPHVGWCKVNTDGSMGTRGDAGAGIVIRDSNGAIGCRDALQGELCAMSEGLSIAQHWCNQSLILKQIAWG
jgi:hypothetical protein